jgi:spore germination protein KB
MRYGKISIWQAAFLAFICRVYRIITYTPIFGKDTEILATVLGEALSCVGTLILCIPIFLLFQKRKNHEDIISMCYQVSPIFGGACHVLFLFCMFAALLNTLVHFQFFMTNAVFPEAPQILFIGTMLLAAAYAAWMGLEGIARANTIIVILFFVSFLFILISCLEHTQWVNLRPIFSDPVQTVIREAWIEVSRNIETIVLMLFFTNLNSSGESKTLWIYWIFSSVVLVAVSLITAMILGDYEFRQVFPFFGIASIIDMGTIRRFDAIHMVIWTLVAFIRTSVYLLLCNVLVKRFLPDRFHPFVLPILIVISFLSSWMLSQKLIFIQIVYTFFDYGVLTFLLTAVIPLIVWISQKRKHSDRLKSEGNQ